MMAALPARNGRVTGPRRSFLVPLVPPPGKKRPLRHEAALARQADVVPGVLEPGTLEAHHEAAPPPDVGANYFLACRSRRAITSVM